MWSRGQNMGKLRGLYLIRFWISKALCQDSEEIFLYIRYSIIVGELAANECDGERWECQGVWNPSLPRACSLGHSTHAVGGWGGVMLSPGAQHLPFLRYYRLWQESAHVPWPNPYSLLFFVVYHELKADISFLIYSRSSLLLREEQITYLLSSQERKAGTLFVFVYLCLVLTTRAVLCSWPSASLIRDHKQPEDSLNQTLKHPSRFSLLLF